MTGSSLGGGAPEAPLHVVITSPFVWPWVRRGSERMLNDLSRYLASRGHRVTVFATAPEDRIEDREGVRYHLLGTRLGLRPRQLNALHDFAFRLQRPLAECRPDVVFCMHYFDAYAALRARKRSGRPFGVIFHSVGILSRRHFRAVPLDAWFFRTVRRESDLTVAVSRFAGEVYRREFGTEAVVIAPPVVVEQFAAGGAAPQGAPQAPILLFVGDADERRKGARPLCLAFARVARRVPDARLVFAGHASASTREALTALCAQHGVADRVDFPGVGRVEDLPGHYRRAAVTVLPSTGESFGMSLVESLAAGTPVVSSRHGGPAEIVDSDLVGRLFDPGGRGDEVDNVEGLAEAILAVLARGKPPEVAEACRRRAAHYGFGELGPVYEALLARVAREARAGSATGSRP